MSISRAGWNDAISSIKVDSGGVVHVCRDRGLKGGCTILARSQPYLGAFDNAISSFAVFSGRGSNGVPAR